MSRSKFSKEAKLPILNICKEGRYSVEQISAMYGVSYDTIKSWVYKYGTYGIDGLRGSENLEAIF